MRKAEWFVAIILPRKLAVKIRKIQEQARPEHSAVNLPPHITLLPPGRLMGKPEDLVTIIRDIANPYRGAAIKMTGVGRFERGRSVIFLGVQSRPLHALHKALAKATNRLLASPETSRPYTPHITLAKHLDREALAQAWPALRHLDLTATFPCQALTIFRRFPESGSWQKIITLKL